MPCFFVMSTYQLKKVFERRISNPPLQVCRALSGGEWDAYARFTLLFIIFQVESELYPKTLLELIYNLISPSPCNKLAAPLK